MVPQKKAKYEKNQDLVNKLIQQQKRASISADEE